VSRRLPKKLDVSLSKSRGVLNNIKISINRGLLVKSLAIGSAGAPAADSSQLSPCGTERRIHSQRLVDSWVRQWRGPGFG
jgi:hypothetical protein